MNFFGALMSFAVVAFLVAIPVLLVLRLRRTTAAMQQIPDDLRRADDGDEPNAADGQGLGPLWPTN